MTLYRITLSLTLLLFAFLFTQLMVVPGSFLESVGLTSSISSLIITRRAAIFMLGIVVLLISAFKLKVSHGRLSICASLTIVLWGLAAMSSYELYTGHFNQGIVPAIFIESGFACLFSILVLLDYKQLSKNQQQ